mmetsp:Transcript_13141/g.30850  ORF Transcript_13141/g.30850 Transcript_13141/m.30850 type:complete len:113 (-) Transcript_13141:65-403(-)
MVCACLHAFEVGLQAGMGILCLGDLVACVLLRMWKWRVPTTSAQRTKRLMFPHAFQTRVFFGALVRLRGRTSGGGMRRTWRVRVRVCALCMGKMNSSAPAFGVNVEVPRGLA